MNCNSITEQLDAANELINTLYESGCLDVERENLVRQYLNGLNVPDKNKDTLNIPSPPPGFTRIFDGSVRTSDLVFNIVEAKWMHPTPSDYDCLGSAVSHYYGVARSINK